MKSTSDKESQSTKFGTFGGVFVPNVLTILGVIMFMRTGWVVGQAGLYQALIILCIANAITLLTSFSLSAVATNTKVGAGGAYFMISRSLGLEVGGSIGVPLFLAQAVSVAFYSIGFAESLTPFFPEINVQYIAFGVITAILLVTLVGSAIAIKAQYLIFGILLASLISFFLGHESTDNLSQNLTPLQGANKLPFWTLFAIFFPAVTGVMSGASMSGDLKNPTRSIPLGTLLAVVVTFLVYAGQMYWLSAQASREQLLNDPLVMKSVARIPNLIYAGLWAAVLSSALASLLAAPRTLQALASDGVAPRFLARLSGAKKEPRVALVVSFIIAMLCVLIGDLNAIAPIISMFFLATYGMLNFVSFIERIVSNPSYRPTFRVHWIVSLTGAIGCIGVMFLLSSIATIAATTFMLGLYIYLQQKRYKTAWGDMRSGLWFSMTRWALVRFQHSARHTRNWRPVILVLSGNPNTRKRLVQFAEWMESKRGYLFICHIIVGPWEQMQSRCQGAQDGIDTFIDENKLTAMSQVVTAETFEDGITTLVQATGVNPIFPNTVLLGWSEDEHKQSIYKNTVRRILASKKNLVFFVEAEPEFEGRLDANIDIWWGSKQNGKLMATIAHLISTNSVWKKHALRVFLAIEDESGAENAAANMTEQLKQDRIDAQVIVKPRVGSLGEMISENSKFSEICFLGIDLEGNQTNDLSLDEMNKINTELRGNIFVTRCWEDFA
ncbi:MAG: amino acid transporter [Candidatus Pelagisphaera sp.]